MSRSAPKSTAPNADLASEAAESTLALNPVVGLNSRQMVEAVRTTALQGIRHPLILTKHLAGYGRKLVDSLAGETTYATDRKDRRFQHPAWRENPVYHTLLQTYLAFNETLDEWLADVNLTEADRLRVQFVLRLLSESIAPTNTLVGNPAALERARETGGKSIMDGLMNLLDDLRHNGGMPTQVDKSQFEVGTNLALSPGAVVFKNDILELIQYQASTEQVYERPLLLVPPQINKFYAMDLTPDKSLIKFAVDNGVQVFAISWRNPGPEHSDWGLSEYVEAVENAISAIKSITGSTDLNLIAFCSGGVTASVLAGHLAAIGDASIHSMTIGVCVLGMEAEDSDMSAFSSEAAIKAAREQSAKAGVLRGKDLARTFNWMRPNDLIWNYVVNNYLMGNSPPAFDILFWNNDTTNLPARLHSDYLDIFARGSLDRPGEFQVCNTPVDLGQVDCDKLFIAGVTDHITPWKACYRSSLVYGGEATFVLSNSGHVQSLINPPGNPRASFYTNAERPGTAEEWLAGAQRQQGSWWPLWMDWLQHRSGEMKTAPQKPGNSRFKAGAAAPGSYVHEKAE